MGCPWVSPSVNNEVGRSGWKKGYFHCSSDVTFSTGFFPQDSFSYFLFRFPAPHSSFGILDIVLFCFRLVLLFPSPRGTKRLALEGSSTLRGNLHLPSQTYILQGCPRTPLELTIYPPPPQLLLLFKVRGRRRILLALWTPSFPSTVSAVRGSPLRYSLAKADVLFFLGRCFLK